MERECLDGKNMGFNGKQCIHPSQVDVAQRAFAPGRDEVEWAVRVVVADAKAGGRGAWALDGKMVDVPVVKRAGAIIDRAAGCGFDVETLRGEMDGPGAGVRWGGSAAAGVVGVVCYGNMGLA